MQLLEEGTTDHSESSPGVSRPFVLFRGPLAISQLRVDPTARGSYRRRGNSTFCSRRRRFRCMGKCPPHQISRTRCLKNWSLRASRIALLILLSKIASMCPLRLCSPKWHICDNSTGETKSRIDTIAHHESNFFEPVPGTVGPVSCASRNLSCPADLVGWRLRAGRT